MPTPNAEWPDAVALPNPVPTDPAAWSPTPLSRIPFAPRLAASAFKRCITAFVLPCAVIEKEFLLDVSSKAISSYLPAGGCRYICTWSGEIGGRARPIMTCDVTHPAIAIKLIAAATTEALATLIIGISHVLIYEGPSEQLARGKGVNDLPVLAGGPARVAAIHDTPDFCELNT